MESEIVKVVLVGLSTDFDAVLTLASWSTEPLSLRKLVDILLEYENRQQKLVVETTFQANLVEVSTDPEDVVASGGTRGGRLSFVGRGRGGVARGRPQCQICDHLDHLAH